MARNPTTWANNDIKSPATWAGASKQTSAWTNNDTKLPALYTPVTKNNDSWAVEHPSQTYFFDDIFSFDSVMTEFDYLVNGNTDNQRLTTPWNQVV